MPYDGALTVTAGGEAREIPVSLSVADVLLPPESLKITNWFSVRNMAAAHGFSVDAKKTVLYGVCRKCRQKEEREV